MRGAVLLDEGVRALDLFDPGKAADARLDRDEDDLRLGNRGVHLAIERREVVRDLLRRVIRLDVVVAGVEHDHPRLVGNHDAIGVAHRIGRERAAESAVDRLLSQFRK